MRRLEIKPGETYGDLKIIKEVESRGKRHFLCQCACGGSPSVHRLGHLRSGHATTCGRCGFEFEGQRKTIADWAELYGLKESTLRARLKVMGVKEALERT